MASRPRAETRNLRHRCHRGRTGGGRREAGGGKKNRTEQRGRDAHIYDQAIRFIETNKDRPFYVNVWGHISHHRVDPVQSLVDRWSGLEVREADFPVAMRTKFAAFRAAGGDVNDAMRRYLADVESLDDGVGLLLKRLDELGLRDNTLVIFSSDQGADMSKASLGGVRFNQMGFNGPHRGGKHTNLEGGLRVPFILRWPGHVPAGLVDENSVLSGTDSLPTLCALTGTRIDLAHFDGEDASNAWLGKATHVRTKPLLWKASSPGAQALIRVGKWKLFHPIRKNAGEFELYDIEADPGESQNLGEQEPEIMRTLVTRLESWVATLPNEYLKTDDKQD
jgi:arylsulfatase A-like enzyme